MKVIKLFKRGKNKGWNIRQKKDEMFDVYFGGTFQFGSFKTFGEAKLALEIHNDLRT
jgi:hypothetical protein